MEKEMIVCFTKSGLNFKLNVEGFTLKITDYEFQEITEFSFDKKITYYDMGYKLGRIYFSNGYNVDIQYLDNEPIPLYDVLILPFDDGFIQAMYDVRKEHLKQNYIEFCLQEMHHEEYKECERLSEYFWKTGKHEELDKIASRFDGITYEDLANCF